MKPVHFKSADAFRRWLEKHHASVDELFVGFYKKASGKTGISYKEAVDEALCFGWIDGIKKRVDADAYTHRFTPRKAKSYWSAVNVARAKALIAAGRMCAPGLEAFERRDQSVTERYSFERAAASLTPAQLKTFKANAQAWAFFSAQPPGYQKIGAFYVVSAKREETRAKRLNTLIAESAAGRRLGLVSPTRTIPPQRHRGPQRIT